MYKEISSNKRRSYLIMFLFAGFVIGLGILFGSVNGDPYMYLIPAFILSVITTFIGYYKSDSLVLSISGAKQVDAKNYPKLYHILENLCISIGFKTIPKLYIITDRAPNAFATGRDPKHSAIAVTEGLIDKLNNSELEGVIAHELSHIKNYDIRLASIAVVFVGIVVLMSDFFLRLSLFRNRSKDENKSNAILLIIGLVLAILSPIFAKLLQLAVSRKREFLADSSAALITRYPEGLASALEKISMDTSKFKYANKATAHMYIYSPLKDEKKSFLNNMFSTHPPVKERIKRLRGMAV